MPHWDFQCEMCGTVHDWSFNSFSEMERVVPTMTCDAIRQPRLTPGPLHCWGRVTRLTSVAAFAIHGHSAANGYNAEKVATQDHGSIKVKVHGDADRFNS